MSAHQGGQGGAETEDFMGWFSCWAWVRPPDFQNLAATCLPSPGRDHQGSPSHRRLFIAQQFEVI